MSTDLLLQASVMRISAQQRVDTLAHLVHRFGPVFTQADAARVGVGPTAVRRMRHEQLVLPVGRGAFALPAPAGSGQSWETFRRRAVGVGLTTSEDVFLSEWAAVALHGLPAICEPPTEVVGIKLGHQHHGPSISPGVRIRHGQVPLGHRWNRDRVSVISPAFTVVEIARHFRPLDGLLVADAALHRGATRETMLSIAMTMRNYPGIDQVAWVLEHADPRSESPVETLGRFAFISAGLAAPLCNVWIDAGGQCYRADLYVEELGVVVEADGDLKYDNRPDASAVVKEEKARELKLRQLGFGVVRFNFALALNFPDLLVRLVQEEGARRRGEPPTCWSFEQPVLRQVG